MKILNISYTQYKISDEILNIQQQQNQKINIKCNFIFFIQQMQTNKKKEKRVMLGAL